MSNWRSSVEKMKRLMMPTQSEKKLFCVVYKVARPERESNHADVLAGRMHDSIYRSGYGLFLCYIFAFPLC
jgi:hypothetical protein